MIAKNGDRVAGSMKQISAESVTKTNIGSNRIGWAVGKRLNLERALKVGDELGGHIVSGHVDGVAEIIAMRDEGDSTRYTFRTRWPWPGSSHRRARSR